MNKIRLTILASLISAYSFAQSPDKMSYQAVIRNSSNKLVSNTAVGMRISILKTSATGSAVYVETQKPTTNLNGLASIEIGSGTVVSGTFAAIDWSKGPYFIKTETDPSGGTSYSITGTSQLLSVPYALYAKSAGNGFSGNYNDLTNKPAIPIKVGDLANDKGYISKYTEKDSSVTNELQALSIRNDTVFLSKGGGFVALPKGFSGKYNDLSDKPNIPSKLSELKNDTGYITKNALKDTSISNELQSLSVRNDTVFLSKNGGFVVLPKSNSSSNSVTANGSFYFDSRGQIGANDSNFMKYSSSYPSNIKYTYQEYSFLIPKEGIIKNLIATPTQSSVASGSTVTVSILINGKPTSLYLSFSNADGFNHKINATNSISVKQGDFIAIQYKSKGSVSPGTFFQAIVELAPNANKNEFAHYIGELYGGGIVVSVWKDTSGAEHGLVASLKDLSSGMAWSNVSSTLIGSTAQSGVDGQANTNAIISQSGHTVSAAQLCDTFTGGGYSDWYLPATLELNICCRASIMLNAILGVTNGFKNNAMYWSSTEGKADYALVYQFFGDNNVGPQKSVNTCRVRAIRRF